MLPKVCCDKLEKLVTHKNNVDLLQGDFDIWKINCVQKDDWDRAACAMKFPGSVLPKYW